MRKYNYLSKIFFLLFLWLVLIVIVNKMSRYLIPDRTSYEISYPYNNSIWHKSLIMPFVNFDGRNYLAIAERGYFDKGSYSLYAFFPLYPLLIRLFHNLTGLNSLYTGLLLSFLSFFVAIYLFCALMRDTGFEKVTKVLFLLFFFPTSFFFVSFYTESLFFLLIISCFLFLNRKMYFWAGFAAALASATRITGLSLFPVLFFSAYKSFKKDKKLNLFFLMSPLGFLAYCLFLLIKLGRPLEMISSQVSGWGKPMGLFGPFYFFKQVFLNLLSGPLNSYDNVFVYPVIVLEFFFLLFLIFVIVFSFNKIKIEYWIFMLVNFLIIIFSGSIASLPRYMLVLFPLYIFLADLLSPKFFILYSLLSMVLFLFFSSLFLRGYFVS